MEMMKHTASAFRKFQSAARCAGARMGGLPGGLFLTDPARVEDPATIIETLPDGIGVIVRHFGIEAEIARAHQLVSLCKRQKRLVLIAADPGLAEKLKADGVHWPFRLRRRIRRSDRPGWFNTLSVHSPAELRLAQTSLADALIMSTVFASDSPTAGNALGLPRFARAAQGSQQPVYALGGITPVNAGRVSSIGGFASVSGFLNLQKS
jgi:thiamine monophosphate synthase